eukprot:COSAG05_NODE_24034_length_254_cov_0.664516_1_plen_57_part_01
MLLSSGSDESSRVNKMVPWLMVDSASLLVLNLVLEYLAQKLCHLVHSHLQTIKLCK